AQLELFRFVNPAGLQSVGQNNYKVTNGSGDAIGGRPGFDGMGQVNQKFLEMSNVSVVTEMVNMIVAQRAYELNSKAIQTSDTMLGIANGLKR
ncbi:MAG: flagellar hook-basal body complex protein, partial [Spirochaetales bacterium]|nr:flagellar hook-basal body complex protein [Spirochaetales bacterium]